MYKQEHKPILVSKEELLLQYFNKETVKNHKRLNVYCRTDISMIVFNNYHTNKEIREKKNKNSFSLPMGDLRKQSKSK